MDIETFAGDSGSIQPVYDSNGAVIITLAEVANQSDPCKLRVDAIYRQDTVGPYIAIFRVRFGRNSENKRQYGQIIRIRNGHNVFVGTVRFHKGILVA